MKMYIAILPEVWGYGYTAVSEISEEDAINKIREAYYRDSLRINKVVTFEFEERYEYYGGYSLEINSDKVYNDGFK